LVYAKDAGSMLAFAPVSHGYRRFNVADPIVVDLPENLTIATAESLHEQLEPHTSGSTDIVFNPAAVTRADTAGLQLLYVFINTLKSHGAACSWNSTPTVIVEAAEQLGLKEHLLLE
jgi:anti-anti-sigma regulatory factor